VPGNFQRVDPAFGFCLRHRLFAEPIFPLACSAFDAPAENEASSKERLTGADPKKVTSLSSNRANRRKCSGTNVVKELGWIFREQPVGLATDEAIGWFLRRVDWRALGATPRSSLPASAEPVLVDVRLRRRGGSAYDRVETPWGDLFLDGGHPAFFAPVR
jgi:hypothetical protein